VKNYKYSEKGP